MRFTTKAKYGLVALADIALYSGQGEKVTTVEISQRQHISQKYLEQILMQLRQANIIRAEKGQKGGYYLTRSAEHIKIADVMNALDSNILADSADIETEDGIGMNLKICLWDKINSYMREYMNKTTLAELLKQCSDFDACGCYVI